MKNALLIFAREVRDQLRDRRTLFMLVVLPLLLYPMLAYLMLQAYVLFNEQARNVVVLGTEELPEPSLLVESEQGVRIDPQYFASTEEADKLLVVTDAEIAAAGRDAEAIAADPTSDDLLRIKARMVAAARRAEALIDDVDGLTAKLAPLEERQFRELRGDETVEPLTEAERRTLADLRIAREGLNEAIGKELAAADVQALIVVPPGFRERLAEIDELVAQRGGLSGESVDRALDDATPVDFTVPSPRVITNTADEKSVAALRRLQRATDRWGRELLARRLEQAELPAQLVAPVATSQLDVARTEERAASLWAKLFPVLLVLMSMTGAFYPAIDLGAGEKERGTMETLLICPATRGEIVAGKFFTVFSFSLITTVLNIASMGLTGGFLTDLAAGGGAGGLELPPASALGWVLLLALPMAAMFSALSLALAMFARSSKEGQYYLTPLLLIALGFSAFVSSPLANISPFYSVMPLLGPALMLKALLSPGLVEGLWWYLPPVLISSIGYSVLALWWARDQFNREEILFREADRFELTAWLRHLVTEKGQTPSFAEAAVCFGIIMLMQLAALKLFRPFLGDGGPLSLMKSLVMQQTLVIALPAALLGFALTANIRRTFLLYRPSWAMLSAAIALPLVLHPLTIELASFLQEHFFEPLPDHIVRAFAPMSNEEVPVGLALAVFALAPAICEELAFRGFILTGMSTGRRYALGIVASSLLFGLMHMIPQQVFNAALLGLVLGLLAVRSGSLLPGVVFHAIYNGLQVLRSRTEAASFEALSGGGAIFQTVEGDPHLRYGWGLLIVCGIAAAALITWLVRRPVSPRFEEGATPAESPLADAPAPQAAA